MAIMKPTMKSALAGLNKAIQQLRDVEANAAASVTVQQQLIEDASQKQKAARMERDHAAAVAAKIEALVSPDTAVSSA